MEPFGMTNVESVARPGRASGAEARLVRSLTRPWRAALSRWVGAGFEVPPFARAFSVGIVVGVLEGKGFRTMEPFGMTNVESVARLGEGLGGWSPPTLGASCGMAKAIPWYEPYLSGWSRFFGCVESQRWTAAPPKSQEQIPFGCAQGRLSRWSRSEWQTLRVLRVWEGASGGWSPSRAELNAALKGRSFTLDRGGLLKSCPSHSSRPSRRLFLYVLWWECWWEWGSSRWSRSEWQTLRVLRVWEGASGA